MTILTSMLMLLQASQPSTEDIPDAAPPPPPPPVCSTDKHAEFDFWLGEWKVLPKTLEFLVMATTKIERVGGGCVILEKFDSIGGGDKVVSMTMFNAATKRWERVWIDSNGIRREFSGGLVGDKMVLTSFWQDAGMDESGLNVRYTYSPTEEGDVILEVAVSSDHGISWQSDFEYIYRREGSAPQGGGD